MISQLQFTKQKWNSGLTESNNLAQALMTEPEIVSRTLAYAFGEKYQMQFLTMGSGRVSEKFQLIGNDQYRWPLQGFLTKAIPVSGAVSPSSNVGLNRQEFRLILAEKYFAPGDVVAFDSRTLARIQAEPVQVADGYQYRMVLLTADDTDTLAAADYAIGAQVSFEYTAFEEYSKGGSSKESYPMWFQNQLTTSRMSFGMSGSAQTDVMVLSVGGRDGKKGTQLWMYEKEYQFMLQWMEQTERQRWYGVYNRDVNGEIHLPGENGRPVKTGSGLLEQIAYSNTRNYTEATEKLFREFMLDMMQNAKEAENKKFIAFTGLGGLDEFHRAMKNSLASTQIIDTHFISGSGDNLTLGGQFTTYKGLLGSEITIAHLPMLDNPVTGRKLHPLTGRPLESYRFIMLDFGMYGGESNISLIAKGADGIDRSLRSWYTAGSQTPPGVKDSGAGRVMRSSELDGWQVHFLSETGIKLINPLSCGQLVCTAA